MAASRSTDQPLLTIEDLSVAIDGRHATVEILKGVSLALPPEQMHGLVGETGSGKSMTAWAVMGLLPRGGRVTRGRILFQGCDLAGLDERKLRAVRGRRMAMIFQNPRTALHPMLSVRKQMGNIIDAHLDLSPKERDRRIREYLALAGLSDPDRVMRSYPHELSGGMAQRVVIASALVAEPALLIADEPTTGLDLTIQRQILELLASLQQRLGLAVLMITHDLSIIAQFCHSLSVMNEGVIVEDGPSGQILDAPSHAYTKRLIAASILKDVRSAEHGRIETAAEIGQR